ncbi:DUF2203 family protein [Alkalihalobacterium chitinilyticum]|uniref:DUF2203 family protein n=1 Tax=Alkalihalobacterium chitinilyticum TaxID=2980103 RepID=UPI003F8D0A9E
MEKKYFTIEEANELLPLLEVELTTLQQIQTTFQLKIKQLKELKASRDHQRPEQGIFTLESELEFLQMEANLHLRNIESKGVQLKGIDLGLLDFLQYLMGKKSFFVGNKVSQELPTIMVSMKDFLGESQSTKGLLHMGRWNDGFNSHFRNGIRQLTRCEC